MQVNFREIWYNYRSEVVFFLILSVCVALSHCLSHYIPTELFDDVIAPLQNAVTTAICLFGAYVLFRHPVVPFGRIFAADFRFSPV